MLPKAQARLTGTRIHPAEPRRLPRGERRRDATRPASTSGVRRSAPRPGLGGAERTGPDRQQGVSVSLWLLHVLDPRGLRSDSASGCAAESGL